MRDGLKTGLPKKISQKDFSGRGKTPLKVFAAEKRRQTKKRGFDERELFMSERVRFVFRHNPFNELVVTGYGFFEVFKRRHFRHVIKGVGRHSVCRRAGKIFRIIFGKGG